MTADLELDLEAFLRAERAPAADAEAGKEAVRARLAKTLGRLALAPRPAPAPATATPPRAGAIWKVPLLVATGFGLGLATHAAWDRRAAPTATHGVSAPAEAATSTPVPSALPPPPVVDVSSLASAPPSTAAAVTRSAPADGRGDLSAERTLLETARTALERSDPGHALDALDRHRQRFPRGQLREERESLTVGALVAAGRVEEARAKTAEFHRTFPKSLQGPALDALVEQAP